MLKRIGYLLFLWSSAALAQQAPVFDPPLTAAEQQQLLPDSLVRDAAANVAGVAQISSGNANRAYELAQQNILLKREIAKLETDLAAAKPAEKPAE